MNQITGETRKRFEDWEEVDCDDCAHYWDSSCDGVSKGKKQPCNSFLATRSIVIPLQINSLKNDFKRLVIAFHILGSGIILHLIGHLINLY